MAEASESSTAMPPAKPIKFTLIAALSPSNGLGINGGLAWSLKGEMAYFRRATLHVPEKTSGSSSSATAPSKPKNAVIMGRNTWQSIPPKFRPLKGRINVVVSRTVGEAREKELGISSEQDSYLVSSLPSALSLLSSFPPSRLSRAFLIGGSQLYTQALKDSTSRDGDSEGQGQGGEGGHVMDKMLITRIVEPEYHCDVFLPEYRTQSQIQEDHNLSDSSGTGTQGSPMQKQKWSKASYGDLADFVGGTEAVQEGIVQEGETKYEFQMWNLEA